MWQIHKSELDRSVNFVHPLEDGGAIEARYVRRDEDYFIAYVSSHSGCRLACRFCHLTQSGETMFAPQGVDSILGQVNKVLEWHDSHETPARRMNVNFMARGDVLANEIITARFARIADGIAEMSEARGLGHRLNLSSIFPREAGELDLAQAFGDWPVTLFWSLYSTDPAFRRRWMPRADAPEKTIRRLVDWQMRAGGEVVLHWALIRGVNDDEASITAIAEMVRESGLEARFNLVRYNSWSQRTGEETPAEGLEAAMRLLLPSMRVPGSRIVPRVGYDVAASCGMFVTHSG